MGKSMGSLFENLNLLTNLNRDFLNYYAFNALCC